MTFDVDEQQRQRRGRHARDAGRLSQGMGAVMLQLGEDLARRLDAVDAREMDIHDDHVGGLILDEFQGRIAIIADKNIPYATIFRVLYTAGRAEFGKFKLFVQKP